MKKIIFLFALLLSAGMFQLFAQPVLYGLTSQGGGSVGTIIKLETVSNNLSAVYSFPSNSRNPDRNDLTQASNGKLYGMTWKGGSNGVGTIFSFDPVTNTQTKLHDFNNSNGSSPNGSLVQASDGKLYGMTQTGGSSGNGTIFSFDPVTNMQTKLHDFNNTNGSSPYGSLVQANDGKLYGMTSLGGSSDYGTIFSFDPGTNTHNKLYDFNNTNGRNPISSLVEASDGKLYGMTKDGGSNGDGTIFSFDPGTNTQTKLLDFNYTNGGAPWGSLVQASNAKLYGMTSQGGSSGNGTIFSFDPVTNMQTKLHDFNNTNGSFPYGSLVQANDGKLYGMTSLGGSSDYGTIFSFDPGSNTQTKIQDFNLANGGYPHGSLMQASDGKLYGMTSMGSSSGYGTIFSFDPGANTQTNLYGFNNINGSNPHGSFVQASDGKLYGMTSLGGSSGYGTIFSFNPGTNKQTKLHDFNNSNGSSPYGSLVQAGDGKLYGMTVRGGSSGNGTIFSFDPVTNTQTKLHDFNNSNGSSPNGSLVQASDGKLYGMTSQGGSSDNGTIFSFDPVTNTQTNLHDFNITNGSNPNGSLVQASDGKLYGMTSLGGSSGSGTIFSFDPVTNTPTKLHDFNNSNGSSPYGSLVQAGDGKLYGMTVRGGSSDYGTIFSFDPGTNMQTKLHDFNFTNGGSPNSSLVETSDGKLYGMTQIGGSFGIGTIFSFNPVTNTHTKLQDFNEINGAYPYGSLIELIACVPTAEICDGVDNNCNGQIDEDCPPLALPEICISDIIVHEGDHGNKNAIFTVWLKGKSTGPVSFQYHTKDGSATELDDYIAKSGTITFDPNCLVKTITVKISGDRIKEHRERFILVLTDPVNVVIDDKTATCTIIDDDKEPTIRIHDAKATENSQLAKIKVRLDDESKQVVKVKYDTRDKSAKSPADYTGICNGQLVFLPGETEKYIEVVIKKDFFNEKMEEFELVLKDADNAQIEHGHDGRKIATVKIINSGTYDNGCTIAEGNLANQFDQPLLGLQLKVLPNPSQNYFQLNINSNVKGSIHLRVTDVQGRVVEDRKLEGSNQQIKMGDNWRYGNYFLELTQGGERKIIQLVKLK